MLFATLALAASILFIATAMAHAETRSLKLYYVHTGERAEIAYKRNGRYLKSGLEKINHLLRDWRRNEPANMDPKLLDALWEVYRQSGSRDYIHVVSAYRSPQTNAMLRQRSSGVAQNSQHMGGKAIDFFLPDVKLSKLRAIALKLHAGGVGYYPRSGSPFLHLDVGGVRHWPRMSRKDLLALFPNGETLHIPSDGKPLPGYQQALAAYKARQRSGSAIQVADDTTDQRTKGRGLLAALFGGGADEAEDNAEAAVLTAQRQAPSRQQAQRQPQPPQAIAQQTQTPQSGSAETGSPATIIAALPARSLPIPREAPRPDTALTRNAEAEEPAEIETTTPADTMLATLHVPLPSPRPEHEFAQPTDVASVEQGINELPAPIAYVTPTRRPDLPSSSSSDIIAELLGGEAQQVASAEPLTTAQNPAREEVAKDAVHTPDQQVVAILGDQNSSLKDSAVAKASAFAALSASSGDEMNAPSAITAQASARSVSLDHSGAMAARERVAVKKPRPSPEDAAERSAVALRSAGTPTDRVLDPHSVLAAEPQLVAGTALSRELTEAPKVVYTTGFGQDMPVPDARRFTGQAVTFLSLARFDHN